MFPETLQKIGPPGNKVRNTTIQIMKNIDTNIDVLNNDFIIMTIPFLRKAQKVNETSCA